MTQTLIKTASFDFPARVVLTALTSAEFLEQSATAREGVVGATYKEVLREGARLSFEVHTEQHARGIWGVRRNKTEISIRKADWDLEAMRCEWTVESEHARLFDFRGVTQIASRGEASSAVRYEYVLKINFPIFGPAIERAVLREFDTAQAPFDEQLRSYCAAHSTA